MSLKAEQRSQIATAYEKAAADPMIPAPQRAAFARKAEWFLLLARIAAKNEARLATTMDGPRLPEDLRPLIENVMKGVGR
jgi:hypothetical protein